jgi:hypothetical protein
MFRGVADRAIDDGERVIEAPQVRQSFRAGLRKDVLMHLDAAFLGVARRFSQQTSAVAVSRRLRANHP